MSTAVIIGERMNATVATAPPPACSSLIMSCTVMARPKSWKKMAAPLKIEKSS